MIECFLLPDGDQTSPHSQAESKLLTSNLVLTAQGSVIFRWVLEIQYRADHTDLVTSPTGIRCAVVTQTTE